MTLREILSVERIVYLVSLNVWIEMVASKDLTCVSVYLHCKWELPDLFPPLSLFFSPQIYQTGCFGCSGRYAALLAGPIVAHELS